jgi:hypothetical protein
MFLFRKVKLSFICLLNIKLSLDFESHDLFVDALCYESAELLSVGTLLNDP